MTGILILKPKPRDWADCAKTFPKTLGLRQRHKDVGWYLCCHIKPLPVALQVLGLGGAQDLRHCPGGALGPPGEAVVGTENVRV